MYIASSESVADSKHHVLSFCSYPGHISLHQFAQLDTLNKPKPASEKKTLLYPSSRFCIHKISTYTCICPRKKPQKHTGSEHIKGKVHFCLQMSTFRNLNGETFCRADIMAGEIKKMISTVFSNFCIYLFSDKVR